MSTLWEKTFDSLKGTLSSGSYTDGELFATVESVVTQYGVSIVTARRALQELAKTGLVRNVPHQGCVVLGKKAQLPIYFIPTDRIVQSAVQYANQQKGIFGEAMLHGINIKSIEYEQLFTLPSSQKAIVLFLNYANHVPTEALIAMLPGNFLPICCGSYSRYTKYTRGIYLFSDFEKMGQQMVKRLYDRGCRRIGYFGPTYGDCFFERFNGYLSGMKAHGLPFDHRHLFNLQNITDDAIDESEFRRWYTEGHFDGIHTSGLKAYRTLLKMFKQTRCSAPKGITTIGFSPDGDEGALLFYPNFEEMGRKAIQLALKVNPEEAFQPNYSKSVYVPYGERADNLLTP